MQDYEIDKSLQGCQLEHVVKLAGHLDRFHVTSRSMNKSVVVRLE